MPLVNPKQSVFACDCWVISDRLNVNAAVPKAGYSFGASFLKNSVPELRDDFDVPPHFHTLHNESSLQSPYLFLGGAGSVSILVMFSGLSKEKL